MRRRFIGGDTLDVFNINDYCTIEALDTNVSVVFSSDIEYGIDGVGWKLLKKTTIVKIQSGQCISFRGNLVPTIYSSVGTFRVNGSFNLKGNIMSLLHGDDAIHNFSLLEKPYVFSRLFYNNDGLKSVSSDFLPATTLADFCYESMFEGCTSLTTAPELPATTLTKYCYFQMFKNCNKLNYIKMLATNISATSCLYSWVQNVSSTGTFIKNPAMTSLPTGISGIPSGWTVVDDGEESGNLITFTVNGTEYQAEEGMTWEEFINSEYNDGNFTSAGSTVSYNDYDIYIEGSLSEYTFIVSVIRENGSYVKTINNGGSD